MTLVLTLAVFIGTLVLVFVRPRGMHEAWATCGGGLLMLLLRLETPRQAWETVRGGGAVLLFLLGLMLLSACLERSGFFEWAALHACRGAQGSAQILFRNVFLLGAACTALLSLDTTAIILTPVVLASVRRLGLKPLPFLLACAFVSNTGSLLLPVSNLTNLLLQVGFGWSFGLWTARMALPQIAAVLVNYGLFAWAFRRDLPPHFDATDLPAPTSAVTDGPFFRGALVVLGAVLVGYFAGPHFGVPPWAVALTGAGLLAGWGGWRGRVNVGVLRDVSWPLFPFVAGLFVVVRGVENLGLADWAARGLSHAGSGTGAQILTAAVGAGVGANVVNNIPMALLSSSVLGAAHAGAAAQGGAALGCALGPNLTVAGSLATMLVMEGARRRGEDMSAAQFLRVGLWATGPILAAAALALWLTLFLVPH